MHRGADPLLGLPSSAACCSVPGVARHQAGWRQCVVLGGTSTTCLHTTVHDNRLVRHVVMVTPQTFIPIWMLLGIVACAFITALWARVRYYASSDQQSSLYRYAYGSRTPSHREIMYVPTKILETVRLATCGARGKSLMHSVCCPQFPDEGLARGCSRFHFVVACLLVALIPVCIVLKLQGGLTSARLLLREDPVSPRRGVPAVDHRSVECGLGRCDAAAVDFGAVGAGIAVVWLGR